MDSKFTVNKSGNSLSAMSTESNRTKIGFVSTGVPSFDTFLGGGLPLNSVSIVGEDRHAVYSKMFLKCLLSSCVCKQFRIIFVCPSNEFTKFEEVLAKLPSQTKIKGDELYFKRNETDMKIAWRYTNVTPIPEMPATECETFDFGRVMPTSDIVVDRYMVCSLEECFERLQHVQRNDSEQTLLMIESLNFPSSQISDREILNSIYKLKSFSRRIDNIAIVVSMKTQLISQVTKKYLYNIADCVFEVVDFGGSITPYTEYEGLINIEKLPKVNSLNYKSNCETMEIGFKLKKNNRFLVVEKLCLPADVSETASRTTCHTQNRQFDF